MDKELYDNIINSAVKDIVLSKDEALELLEHLILIEGNNIVIDDGVATSLNLLTRQLYVALNMAKTALESTESL